MDVIAVGLADGRIIVHNLKFDETIVDFAQVSYLQFFCLLLDIIYFIGLGTSDINLVPY